MSRGVRLLVPLAAGVLLLGARADAGAVPSTSPYWFEDDYADTTSVNLAATTAVVNTSDSGTVQLPYAPMQAAFHPNGTYAVVATQAGVYAFVFDGEVVRPVAEWNLGSVAATGVAWVDDGGAIAVSTPSQVVVYGIDAGGRLVLAEQAPASGVLGLAPGPDALPSAVLAATPSGAQLYEADGAALVPVSGGPGGQVHNIGVAAARDGSVAATWQQEAVQLWVWSGTTYLPAAAWDPPTPPLTDGPIVGVAFFPQGGGFWVLTQRGQLLAYAYGLAGLSFLPELSLSLPVRPVLPVGVASGWAVDSVGALYPWGWAYEDLAVGGLLGADAGRSLGGQAWAAYAPVGVLQSVALPVSHAVTRVRIEDATCVRGQDPPACRAAPGLPAGTSVRYDVSSDGCTTWTAAPVFTNVPVPSGAALCYRMTLTTSDPTVTPVVDVTDVFEIAERRSAGPAAALLCTGSSC